MAYNENFNDTIDDDRETEICNNVVSFLFEQIPDNVGLYVSDYIDILQIECPYFGVFQYESSNDDKNYKRKFILSKECKKFFLEEDNSTFLFGGAYFCDYMIRDNNKLYVSVYDGCHFNIDKSIKIPQRVLDECERELEMDLTFSDTVTP